MRRDGELKIAGAWGQKMHHQDTGLQLSNRGGNADELGDVLVTGHREKNATAPFARSASGPDKQNWARGQFKHVMTDTAEKQAAEVGTTPRPENNEIGT